MAIKLKKPTPKSRAAQKLTPFIIAKKVKQASKATIKILNPISCFISLNFKSIPSFPGILIN